MAKIDDAVRNVVLYHSKRAVKEVVGKLPSKVRDLGRDVRSLQKAVKKLTKHMEELLEAKREEAPVTPAAEEEVEKARFSKRTLPALRKRFELTQRELAQLLEVGPLTVSSWERGRSKPRGESLAKVVALRSMGEGEVDAALGRGAAPKAMKPSQIKALRDRLGLTQADLARLADVSLAAVTSWETGKSAPQSVSMQALAVVERMTLEEAGKKLGRKSSGAGPGTVAKGEKLTSERIRQIRQKAGLSQKALAEALGVSANSISNWETGKTKPRRITVAKLLSMGR